MAVPIPVREDLGGMEKPALRKARDRAVAGVGVEDEFPEYHLVHPVFDAAIVAKTRYLFT